MLQGMSGLRLGSRRQSSQERGDVFGVWRIAGSDRWVPGVFEKQSDNHVAVTLTSAIGAFDPDDYVMHGLLGSGEARYTLTQARRQWRSGARWPRRPGAERGRIEQWKASGYIVGAHLERPDEERFSSISFTTPQLAEWFTPPKLDHHTDFADSGAHVHVDFELPTPRKFEIRGVGTVSVGPHPYPGFSSGRGYLHMTIEPWWLVEFSEPRTMDDIYTHVALPLMLWTTFCVGAADRFSRIQLGRPSDDKDDDGWQSLTWFPFGWTDAIPEDLGEPLWGHHVPHHRIRDRLPDLLPKWFELYETAPGPVVDSLMSILREPSRFPGPDFLRVMAAAEKYHDTFHKSSRFPEDEWVRLRTRLLDAADGKDQRDLVKNWAKRGNSLPLYGRMKDLLEEASPEVKRIGIANRRVLKSCEGIRNAYAHGEEMPPATFRDMWIGSTLMTFTLRSLFLQRVGLNAEEADSLLAATGEWQDMQHLDPDHESRGPDPFDELYDQPDPTPGSGAF